MPLRLLVWSILWCEFAIPSAGSFWFVMANRADGEVTMRLVCRAPGAR